MRFGGAPGGAPRPATLLLLHHLEPPLEWDRAASVLRAALEGEGSNDPREAKGTASSCPRSLLNPARLQQLLRDIQAAVHEGYVQRRALVQQGALPQPGLGAPCRGPSGAGPQGPPEQQQSVLPPLPKPSGRSYRNIPRLFAAVPQRASLPFFRRALPLLIEACLSADTIFPRCTDTSQQRPAASGAGSNEARAAAGAAAAGSPQEEGRGHTCACGSCRLVLQLYRHCSSGACNSISSERSWGSHVMSSAAEISSGETWVVFGLGFLGLLPPPEWQQTAGGFPDLGDLSFRDFFELPC